MLGHILVQRKEQNRNEKDYGLLLLRFLRHYGSKHNLNGYTTISICNASITFENAKMVKCCQLAFYRAYTVLMESIQGGSNSVSTLGSILDTAYLVKSRMLRSMQCGHIPAMCKKSRERIAAEILSNLKQRAQSLMGVTLEDIKRLNACLYARLSSFIRPADALVSLPSGEQSQPPIAKIYAQGKKNAPKSTREKAKQSKFGPRRFTRF